MLRTASKNFDSLVSDMKYPAISWDNADMTPNYCDTELIDICDLLSVFRVPESYNEASDENSHTQSSSMSELKNVKSRDSVLKPSGRRYEDWAYDDIPINSHSVVRCDPSKSIAACASPRGEARSDYLDAELVNGEDSTMRISGDDINPLMSPMCNVQSSGYPAMGSLGKSSRAYGRAATYIPGYLTGSSKMRSYGKKQPGTVNSVSSSVLDMNWMSRYDGWLQNWASSPQSSSGGQIVSSLDDHICQDEISMNYSGLLLEGESLNCRRATNESPEKCSGQDSSMAALSPSDCKVEEGAVSYPRASIDSGSGSPTSLKVKSLSQSSTVDSNSVGGFTKDYPIFASQSSKSAMADLSSGENSQKLCGDIGFDFIDMTVEDVDLLTISDDEWEELRYSKGFKLGDKGRAILKSRISKHLRDNPHKREIAGAISGVRCATTKQLFQLAQICGLNDVIPIQYQLSKSCDKNGSFSSRVLKSLEERKLARKQAQINQKQYETQLYVKSNIIDGVNCGSPTNSTISTAPSTPTAESVNM